MVPITWRNRTTGASKLNLQDMGSAYLFIVLYVFFEHHLSRGDYRTPGVGSQRQRRWRARAPSARVRVLADQRMSARTPRQ